MVFMWSCLLKRVNLKTVFDFSFDYSRAQCEIGNRHETSQFPYLSNSDDSAAVGLISQTKDLYVLEHIPAIDGSSLAVDDFFLPSDLELPRWPHGRRMLLVLTEEATPRLGLLRRGMSMSFKCMEEDEGIVRSRRQMKEDDERFKKGCGGLGNHGLFCNFKVLRTWISKWRHGNSGSL
ncbi:hypothetical protein BT93_H3047 [Corymbia citriodora subsp. variegata]|nr:hypothetical protein BT93_H3047 [Corymbia citriodora subsp. variegata]